LISWFCDLIKCFNDLYQTITYSHNRYNNDYSCLNMSLTQTSNILPFSMLLNPHKPHLIGNFHNFNNHFKKPCSLKKSSSNMQQTCKKNLRRPIVKKRPCSMTMTMVIHTYSNAFFLLEALKNLISTHM